MPLSFSFLSVLFETAVRNHIIFKFNILESSSVLFLNFRSYDLPKPIAHVCPCPAPLSRSMDSQYSGCSLSRYLTLCPHKPVFPLLQHYSQSGSFPGSFSAPLGKTSKGWGTKSQPLKYLRVVLEETLGSHANCCPPPRVWGSVSEHAYFPPRLRGTVCCTPTLLGHCPPTLLTHVLFSRASILRLSISVDF